ncbi:MAG TPA: protein YgfX [Burkholderiales bacterium]|nr:protein YgfX [Burkholderiales bacterium]
MLDIRLKPSGYLILWLGATHAIALGLFLVLSLPVWPKLVATLFFCISLVFCLKRHAWLTAPSSIIALEIKEDCTCVIETRSGKRLDCILLPTSYVSASLTVLNFKANGERLARHAVLLPDAINPEDFRKLRILLRWKFKAKPLAPIT